MSKLAKKLKKKEYNKQKEHKNAVADMLQKAMAIARGNCRMLNWSIGDKCIHESLGNCLLEIVDFIDTDSLREVVVKVYKTDESEFDGKKFVLPVKELFTIPELNRQLAKLLTDSKKIPYKELMETAEKANITNIYNL